MKFHRMEEIRVKAVYVTKRDRERDRGVTTTPCKWGLVLVHFSFPSQMGLKRQLLFSNALNFLLYSFPC